MGEQENRNLVQQGYQYFKTGDMEGLLSLFAPQIEWELPEMDGVPFSWSSQGPRSGGGFLQNGRRGTRVPGVRPTGVRL